VEGGECDERTCEEIGSLDKERRGDVEKLSKEIVTYAGNLVEAEIEKISKFLRTFVHRIYYFFAFVLIVIRGFVNRLYEGDGLESQKMMTQLIEGEDDVVNVKSTGSVDNKEGEGIDRGSLKTRADNIAGDDFDCVLDDLSLKVLFLFVHIVSCFRFFF
jgi:hypothetical protein